MWRRVFTRRIAVRSVARAAFVVAFTLSLTATAIAANETVSPLPQAHAHNDYEHARPLFDALDQGFCSVEADVFLEGDQLLVGHTRSALKPERTLKSLYLEPLRKRIQANAGRVYPGGPTFTLLIDLKTEALGTYWAVSDALRDYADIFTAYRGAAVDTKAVTAIITGNSPDRFIAAEPLRFAAIDGRKADLESDAPATLVPWISENWRSSFDWIGQGPIPDAEKQKLREFVAKAHAKGRKLRFYGAPDRPELWTELLAAGVDLINADDLAGLRAYLLKRPAN